MLRSRILVIRFSSLGDLAIALAAWRRALVLWPKGSVGAPTEFHFVTKARFLPFVKAMMEQDESFQRALLAVTDKPVVFHVLDENPGSLLRLFRELRGSPFQFCFDLHNTIRSRLLVRLLGVSARHLRKPRFAEWAHFLSRSLFRWLGLPRPLVPKVEATYEVFMGEVLGSPALYELPTQEGSTRMSLPVRIGLAPESAWTTKEWAVENFQNLSRTLEASPDLFSIQIYGVRQGTTIWRTAGNVKDLRGQIGPGELITSIRNLDVLVGNDAGLIHLAEYFGVPVVSIFGPTTPELGFSPRLQPSTIVQSHLWCRPCSKNGRMCHRSLFGGVAQRPCLSAVRVSDVERALNQIVEQLPKVNNLKQSWEFLSQGQREILSREAKAVHFSGGLSLLVFEFLYNWIFYPAFYVFLLPWLLVFPKVRRTMRLRRWEAYTSLRYHSKHRIRWWLHVASVGELEYVLPFINYAASKNEFVAVTYYSVSAKARVESLPQELANVALVAPLPHDGFGNTSRFMKLLQDQGVEALVLVKYELWPGLVLSAMKRGLPIFLYNAVPVTGWMALMSRAISLPLWGYEHLRSQVAKLQVPPGLGPLVGDMRVLRVLDRLERYRQKSQKGNQKVGSSADRLVANSYSQKVHQKSELTVDGFLQWKSQLDRSRSTFVCGSIWPYEWPILESGLDALVSMGQVVFLVPHEMDKGYWTRVLSEKDEPFVVVSRHSGVGSCLDKNGKQSGSPSPDHEGKGPLFDFSCRTRGGFFVLVDLKGVLVELYDGSWGAYVGGGFGKNVHSVWEPALAGCEVFCGPRRDRSPESEELRLAGVLEVVHDNGEFLDKVHQGTVDQSRITRLKAAMGPVVAQHLGSAEKTWNALDSFFH